MKTSNNLNHIFREVIVKIQNEHNKTSVGFQNCSQFSGYNSKTNQNFKTLHQ